MTREDIVVLLRIADRLPVRPRKQSHAVSVVDTLPEDARLALAEFLLVEGLSYHAASARMAERFGVKLSRSAIQRFYVRFTQTEVILEAALQAALELKK